MTVSAPGAGVLRFLPALLAGALSVAAFAPLSWYPLLPVALAVLFQRCLDVPPRVALLHGGFFGLGLFGAGVHWVFVSCYRYGNMGIVAAGLATGLLILYLACFPALTMGLFAALRRGPWAPVLLAPPLWVAMEWVRSWLLTGFPWLAAGYAMTEGPLAGFGPLVGVPGLSLISGILAGALVLAWGNGARRWAGVGLVMAFGLAGQLLRPVAWSVPEGEPITASLVQGNVPQLLKWDPDHARETLTRYEALSAAHWSVDLLVWPENALPMYLEHLPVGWMERIREQAMRGDTTLLTGIPYRAAAGHAYYNAIVDFLNPERVYQKRHLVPFGEYVPLHDALGPLLDLLKVPMSAFSRGAADQPLLAVRGHPIASAICYEIIFEREVRRALPEAQLLLTVSNDTWFGDTLAPHQHLQMARMRALELRRPLLRATNSGITAAVDAFGEEIGRIPAFEAGVLRASVVPRSGATPYVVNGDRPVAAWVLAVVVGTLIRAFWSRRGTL